MAALLEKALFFSFFFWGPLVGGIKKDFKETQKSESN